jgi:serine/threonine protein kinase
LPIPPRLPKYLGDYALLRPLRKGHEHLRFAVRREPQSHPRLYVVKLFDAVPAGTPESLREHYVPRITRGLSHRNLVESYEAGEVTGRNYLVMEYVLSVDLEYVLDYCRQTEQPVPLEVALYAGREICRGLAFLHGFGADKMLHGRVAPSHTLLAYSGQLKLAHVHRLLKVGTATETSNSTSRVDAYQSPELLEGRPVDQRADVFAVGAILWEALSGQKFELPEIGGSQVREIATMGDTSLSDFNSEVPDEVAEVIARALKILPEDRHKTAVDLGRRLDGLLERNCEGAGGRSTSDWLVSLFRDEFRERRHVQQQLLAEKRAETATQQIVEVGDTNNFDTGELIGHTLDDRYKIKRLIGEGGMGRVYEAEHAQLGKRLAVKVLHPLYSTEEEVVERFRREARAASSIGHPNIVNVTDSGTTPDGRAYFVMELLDGMELADVITQEGPLDYERAVDIAMQVCEALGAAHQVGIIHRDLKPENVFLTTVGGRTDVVKILDFGIAKSARLERVRGGQLTEPGLAVGTPEYMAPEQAAGKPPDPRFDIYAVGGILYAILTGRPPHRGSNVLEILTRKATRNPTPPRSYRADIPVELERAIVSALSRNPERRPQTMEEFEYELRKSLQGRPNAVAHMLGISDPMGGFGERTHSSDQHLVVDSEMVTSNELPTVGGLHDGLGLPDDGAVSRTERFTPGGGYSLTGVDGLDDEIPSAERSFNEPGPAAARSDAPIDLMGPLGGGDGDPSLQPNPDAAVTEVFGVPVSDSPGPDREPVAEAEAAPRARLSTTGRQILLALVGGVIGVAALAHTLWPGPPGEPSRPAASASGPTADLVVDDSDSGVRISREIPLIGLSTAVDAGAISADVQARRHRREVARWVAFAWRASRDRRYLVPARDNVKFGIEQIARLDKNNEQIEKLRVHTVNKLIIRARYRRRRGKLEEAEQLLRGVLDLSPDSKKGQRDLAKVLIGKGRRALKADDIPKAEGFAKEALMLDTEGLRPRFFAIDLLIASDKLKDAESAYRAILKAKRRNRQARRGLRALKKLMRRKSKRRRR